MSGTWIGTWIDEDDQRIAEVTDRVDLPYKGPVCVMFPVFIADCHVMSADHSPPPGDLSLG